MKMSNTLLTLQVLERAQQRSSLLAEALDVVPHDEIVRKNVGKRVLEISDI